MEKNSMYKEKIIWILLAVIVSFFVGFHIFVYQHNYENAGSVTFYLGTFLVCMAVFFSAIVAYLSTLINVIPIKMKSIMRFTCVLAFAVLMGIVLEVYLFDFSIIGYKEIWLGELEIDKRWIYDIVIIMLFPTLMLLIQKAVIRNNTCKNRWTAVFVTLFCTLVEFLIFSELANVWLVTMAISNIVTVTSIILGMPYDKMVYGEAAKKSFDKKKKRFRITLCGLYGLFWLSLLGLQNETAVTFTGFMYGLDWGEKVENIRTLISEAAVWGQADSLIKSDRIATELIYSSPNAVHNTLFYGGWGMNILYLFAVCVFMLIMYYFLGRKKKGDKPFYILYQAAFLNFLMRSVLGILYGFGVLAYPIHLPFAGRVGFQMDCISLGLLMFSGLENRLLDENMDELLDRWLDGLSDDTESEEKDGMIEKIIEFAVISENSEEDNK